MVYPITSQIHSETFAKALGWEIGSTPTQGWVFLVGVSPECKSKVEELRAQGIKVAAYWIGTDSYCAFTQEEYRKNIPEMDAHFCVHERIQDELAAWNVKATVVYPCARNVSNGEEAPAQRLVGVYMPEPSPLYMFNECVEIAAKNPDIQFLFYGAPSYPDLPPNIIHGGRMTPEETGKLKISVLLRLVAHDGFPIGGIEAKMKGLHVIENAFFRQSNPNQLENYPGFISVKDTDEVSQYLHDEKVHAGDKGHWPMWYRVVCSPKYFKEKIFEVLQITS